MMAASTTGVINFTQLTLTLLFRCNYRCPSCLVGDKLDSKEVLSFEEAVEIIDSAAKLRSFSSIAFVGGEPFLVYPLMLRIAEYVSHRYGRGDRRVGLSASTNSYWARDLDVARQKLAGLVKFGLNSLLLSWDDFHAQFGKIEQLANAITICNELDVAPTIQNIYINNSIRNAQLKEILDKLCDTSKVDWAENPCTPVGLGAAITAEHHNYLDIEDLPYGGCTAGTILNVEADGSVKPCCGSGLMAAGLTMGNIRKQSIESTVKQASINPLFNSLVGYKGPKHLVETLRSAGRMDLVPNRVTDACDACFKITNNPEAVTLLEELLRPRQIELLLNRAASEELGHIPTLPVSRRSDESTFRRVPNINTAKQVTILDLKSASPEHFREKFLYQHEPVLLRGLDSPAFRFWSEAGYLQSKAGEFRLRATIGMSNMANSVMFVKLADYISIISKSNITDKDRSLYISEHALPLPLFSDIEPLLDELAALGRIEQQWVASKKARSAGVQHTCEVDAEPGLTYNAESPAILSFIGRHTYTDCHEHGGHEAFLVQVAGTKEVILHRPTDVNLRALYADRGSETNWSPIHLCDPDLTAYPNLRDNVPTYTIVQPGEVLYIPDGWFHAVATLGDEVSVTSTLFFPAIFVDFTAAPRWRDLQVLRSSGSVEARLDMMEKILADERTLRSYMTRAFPRAQEQGATSRVSLPIVR